MVFVHVLWFFYARFMANLHTTVHSLTEDNHASFLNTKAPSTFSRYTRNISANPQTAVQTKPFKSHLSQVSKMMKKRL
jgi:hypothetical protein